MYAQKVVSERIALAEKELGFRLEYHKISEVDDFNDQLESRYAAAYSAARQASHGSEDVTRNFQVAITRQLANEKSPALSADEVRFITNERALAMCDCAYFLTRYYWIKPPQGIQRFTFLPGQKAFFDVVSDLEERRGAIELICCKSRQHGVSTETEGIILHRAALHYGVNAIVASADRSSTMKMGQMMFFGYDRMPWWLRPMSTRRVESDKGILEFGGAESGVSFQHGNQRYGIARGDTAKIYHLSEVASYGNPEELIEASLFKCVHPHPDVFGALESTAEGDVGWWYDTYWSSKAQWKRGRSRLCPIFLPWFVGTDKYPTATWLRTHPVPINWKPDKTTRQMMARARLFVDSSPVLGKVMGANWSLPRHQAWYWEVNYMEHRSKGQEKMWFQEMPTDDVESFQGSYESVFGHEVIAEVWSGRKPDYHVYGITGQSIEDRFEPAKDEIDYNSQFIPIAYTNRKKEEKTYRWELVPLNWMEPFEELSDIRDDESHMGKFFVYYPPEPGYDYSIGIDTAGGLGSDDTVIAVARRGRSPRERDVQAAEFRSNLVSHVEAFSFAMAIAAYYARYMRDSEGVHREPYVAVEQIRAVGDTCQLQMSKMGYSRFHIPTRYDSKEKAMRKSKVSKRGWFTTGWSRPILTGAFVSMVKCGWYQINSPYTLREMTQWEVHLTTSGKDKYEHSIGAKDDGIFANAMAAFCANDQATIADRSKNQYVDSGSKKPELDISTPRGVMVNPDTYSIGDVPRDLRAAIARRAH